MRRAALSVLAALVVALALWALWPGSHEARGAAEQRPVRLVLHWKPQAQFAGYYVAAQKGIYAAHGLDVTVIPGGPDIDSLAELRAGRADFALAFLSGALSANGQGAPLVNVCQVINRSSLMLVAWGDTVHSRADLNASRVTLWGSSFRAACDAFFSAAAVHPRLVPQFYTVNLFLRHGVDACCAMEYNEYNTILMSGVDPGELRTFPMRDFGFGFPEDGVYTLAATQSRSPALCADFAAATMEGWEYCRDHPDEALDIVMAKTAAAHVPTNRVHQRWMLDHVLASIFPAGDDSWQPGKLAPADYARTRSIMVGEDQITSGPPYDQFVAPEARVARDLSIGRRLALFFVLGAGLVLASVSAYTFVQAREMLRTQQRDVITQALGATSNRIETVEGAVEKVVQGLSLSAEDLQPTPKHAAALLRRAVQRNVELVGSAVAYNPDIYGRVAPYAYMDGDATRLKDLGRDGRAYEVGDWYQLPYQTLAPGWTEPYYDEGGADMLTATYSSPVHFKRDLAPVSAVVSGDVSLTWLSTLLGSLDLGETGYAFLISQNGTFIAHPDRAFIMNQSIFSVAAAREDPSLRAIGRKMTSGGSGFVSFDGLRSLETSGLSYLAYAPIRSTGWSLGIVYADSEVNGAVIELNRLSWAIDLVGLAALLVIALLIARTITRPIDALDVATQTLARGDLDVPLPEARGRDEVARLTTSFGQMRDDLKERIEELRVTTAERERIESELRIAASIQMSLVPRTFPPYPQRHDLELYALLEPAREVGGDFYDFFLLDEDHLCLAIADVSGKGMPAALMMAVGRSFLRSYARLGGSPSEILGNLNDELSTDNDTSMFVTMFLAVVDLRTGHVRYASAGHNRPFVVRRDGTVEQLPRIRGIALGARAGMVFVEAELSFAGGDVLYLYTDGVSEAMNAADEVFTEERIAVELAQAAGARCDELLDRLNEALREHASGVEQSDDITMVAFRYLGEGAGTDGDAAEDGGGRAGDGGPRGASS